MGRRGPAPAPTALKLAAGNPGKRALPKDEPDPPAGIPSRPHFADALAGDVWDQLVPQLGKIGLARPIDAAALERYCVFIVQWRAMSEFVAKNGAVYTVRAPGKSVDGAKGKPKDRVVAVKTWPQFKAMQNLNRELLILEREFGLTPSARTRIQVSRDKDTDSHIKNEKAVFFLGGKAG